MALGSPRNFEEFNECSDQRKWELYRNARCELSVFRSRETSGFKCVECGCRWFNTPDNRLMGPDGIVRCKGCGHKQTRRESGLEA